MTRPALAPALMLAVVLLSACIDPAPPPERPPPQGREETRGIRNAEAVGSSGNAIANKIDASLDASEQRKVEMDRRAAEATE